MDKKPAPAKAPTRWTPELWADASGSLSRFDMTIVIRAMGESGEWYNAGRRMSHDIEYRGTLDRLPEHPLSEVPVDLRFDTEPHPHGSQYGDAQTLGLVYTGAYGDERTGFPLLSVRIWGDEAGAAAFESAFMRAIAAIEHHGLDRRAVLSRGTVDNGLPSTLTDPTKYTKFIKYLNRSDSVEISQNRTPQLWIKGLTDPGL